ncbi:transketolase-like TK C-terminal-containing protein [Actinacidiphila acidipaludis]|uniref:Transketolase-like C-terminal domain-containing protein n=1 Tax=Actinacidiphila acidipaludis TaxID=2873382 RepID=A0ABS7PZ02_9ACTN|nr:hypothetical protein [Streptomyces acidipaludis]MBY8876081.1 hypothetical protein [Streptomyces acidipaludis]
MSDLFLPEDVRSSLTPFDGPGHQAAMPAGTMVGEAGPRGMYRLCPAQSSAPGPRIQVLASGGAVHRALEAQGLLASDWGVGADVWSVTSWTGLRHEALDADRARLRGEDRVPYLTAALSGACGPVLAVSDSARRVPDQIGPWIEQDFASLGPDGPGRPDTPASVRGDFPVDAATIVVTALHRLRRLGVVDPETVVNCRVRYGWWG